MVVEHIGGHGYPWDLRDEMDDKIYHAIMDYPGDGPYKKGLLRGIGTIINAISNPNKKLALLLVVENIEDAYKKRTPSEIVTLALDLAVKWRDILVDEQPGKDKVRGKINRAEIMKEVKKVLPKDYFSQVFPA